MPPKFFRIIVFLCKYDSGNDPNAKNLTPMKQFSQPALRADVFRDGEFFAPGSLTSIIFTPMVHPCFSAGNERKHSATRFLK